MTSNPNNYQGVNATLVGYLSGDPRNPAYDKSGERGLKEVRIPVNHGYKDESGEFLQTGTSWFTYTAPAEMFEGMSKGTKVRIDDAKMESREYTKSDGTPGSEFTLRFGTITSLEDGAPPAMPSAF